MRLIDAEQLKADVFKASMDKYFMPIKLLDCDTVTEIIDTAPTIEERKTGKWIHKPFEGGYYCSICGRGGWTYPVNPRQWKTCPWCTALMEVDE